MSALAERVIERMLAVVVEEGLVDGHVDPKLLANLFCGLSDDGQAKFLCEAARVMDGWGCGKREQQTYYIASHLRKCECSTDAGREFVTQLGELVRKA